jgi:DnaJ-class molecular chaperone
MNRSGEMSLAMARRVLGVGEKASPDEIRSAYRAAVKTAHPDHGGTAEELRLTLEAWRILEGRPASTAEADGDFAQPSANRLEITPVIAVVGGRMITRLPDGRKAAITLPPGLRAGDKIMASGVRLTITIKGRPDMFVSGDDLCMSIKASPSVFKDGGQLKIKTPTGSRMVWISTVGANNIVRINGQGLPATSRHKQGALLLKLIPDSGAKEPASKLKRRRAA